MMSRPVSSDSIKLRAPKTSGSVLSIPELETAIHDAQRNADDFACANVQIAGVPLSEFRAATRRELIQRAADWTNQVTGSMMVCAECSHHASLLFVTGHQPQLAHPGVWAKNFAVASMAREASGVGLNIIVDNDTVQTQSLRMPSGSEERPNLLSLSFDRPQPQQPWEELKILDRELFDTFGDRVVEAMSNWGIEPLIANAWPAAIQSANQSNSMARALSAARMSQEREWGLGNLELPLSELCQTDSFLKFAAHLIEHAQEFHAAYNEIVTEYRQVHKIRNDRHPVPNLESSPDGLELPLWYWVEGDHSRGQVFVKQDEDRVELSCLGTTIMSSTKDGLFEGLKQLTENAKLRTRALTTTLFSRLCFADQFTHGIGGAKYDEMTDRLIESFFGTAPPRFHILTATCHLPIASHSEASERVSDIQRRLRDLRFNADRYLTGPEADALRERKDQLIRQHWQAQTEGFTRAQRRERQLANRERHRQLKEVQQALHALAMPQEEQLRRELEQAEAQLRAHQILGSREFPAVLFPSQTILDLQSKMARDVHVSL
ncbi:hypothetical protein KOR42_28450 [Thalassoglobus neptunius]|uniref:Uncharacterized protein n=1 Tax=Thalassoglobus neptunius TaxID=1938619 RepID=A0A5C5WYW1_9PLAN|nr:hypothetical protein [Thalassoglobus neptunius]TWT55459.1 hypothetical protein KOR42_28450 [Thalassoglobus neptunius]